MTDIELRQAERAFKTDNSPENAESLLRQQNRSGMTHKMVYLVAEISYMYDDNWHYPSGGYSTHKAFTNRERASKIASEYNRSGFLEHCRDDLASYVSEDASLFKMPEDTLKRICALREKLGVEPRWYEQMGRFSAWNELGQTLSTAHQKGFLPLDLIDEIMGILNITFYEVVNASLEDGICGAVS